MNALPHDSVMSAVFCSGLEKITVMDIHIKLNSNVIQHCFLNNLKKKTFEPVGNRTCKHHGW